MSRQNQCSVPICLHLGTKPITVSNAKKLAERFQVSDDGPPSARRQRVYLSSEMDILNLPKFPF